MSDSEDNDESTDSDTIPTNINTDVEDKAWGDDSDTTDVENRPEYCALRLFAVH